MNVNFLEKCPQTQLSGPIEFIPKIFQDERGYFFESFNLKAFRDFDFIPSFVQDNESFSKKGTIRGMHFQSAPYSQAKLIRVINGEGSVQ